MTMPHDFLRLLSQVRNKMVIIFVRDVCLSVCLCVCVYLSGEKNNFLMKAPKIADNLTPNEMSCWTKCRFGRNVILWKCRFCRHVVFVEMSFLSKCRFCRNVNFINNFYRLDNLYYLHNHYLAHNRLQACSLVTLISIEPGNELI